MTCKFEIQRWSARYMVNISYATQHMYWMMIKSYCKFIYRLKSSIKMLTISFWLFIHKWPIIVKMSCRDKWNMHILPFQLCIRFYSRYHRIISEILFSNDIKRIRNAAKMLTSIYTQISKRLSAFLVFRHEIINVRYLKVDQAWFSKWQVNVRFWGGLFLQKDGYSIVFYYKNNANEQQSASKSFFLYKTMNRVDEYWIYSQVFASLSHKIILLNNATPHPSQWIDEMAHVAPRTEL